MEKLNNSGMRERIDELVLSEKKKVIGICVGMQMMADESDEGKLSGLGWIKGKIKHLSSLHGGNHYLLPHMGWNSVHPTLDNPLLTNSKDWNFYFLHSYYFHTESSDNILATTNYHTNFTSAVNQDNIFGVQFHPEKSHDWGKQLLINFSTI
jgi:glutamine amidotransferase